MAEAAVTVRQLRRRVMQENGWSLRELYRTLDLQGSNPLRDAQDKLDRAVRSAYGMPAAADPLEDLLRLNHELHQREKTGLAVVGPGLPPVARDLDGLVTGDAVGAES